MYSIVFRCLLVVLQVFLALLHNGTVTPFIRRSHLAFEDLSILFLIQSLLFSTVACNATPTRPAERSRVTSLREFGLPVISRLNFKEKLNWSK